MKANKMFFVIISIVIAMVCGIIWFLFSGTANSSDTPKKQDVLDISLKDLTPEELRAMGIEGDTPQDTVRTLIGTVKSNNKKVEEIINQNDQLHRENDALRDKNNNVDRLIDEAVTARTQELTDKFNDLRAQLEETKNQVVSQDGNGQGGYSINGTSGNVPTSNGMQWVEPNDRVGIDGNGKVTLDALSDASKIGFPTSFSTGDESNSTKGLPLLPETDETNGHHKSSKHNKPFYTIPDNSTLMGATAMTALVGRVPINNNVTEPYPFKLLINRENLMANGIELPDIEGAIVSGNATGDWTLSCVRGNITSFTFVFQDGRISTVSQGSGDSSSNQGNLGWLSDNSGIPCVPGERKTNASEYLTTNFLLSGAAAAAQGLSQSQTTTVVDGSSVIGAVTGEQGKFVLGQALGGGLRETADWFKQRYGQTFDAIYVPPGHDVAIHISHQIAIDYDTHSRKVKYPQTSASSRLD